MISVVIPLYNKATTVARALDAVLQQTAPPEEVIIVDDGSTDDGPEIVSTYLPHNPGWRLLTKANGGVSSARNLGIENARYAHICLLDADDAWLSNHCAITRAMIHAHPDCVLYVSGNAKRQTSRPAISTQQPFCCMDATDFYARYSRRPNFVHTSAVTVKRSAVQQIGGFPTMGVRSQDIYVWLRLAAIGQTCYHPAVTSVQYMDSLGLGRRAAEIPYYIQFYTRCHKVPANLSGDLRRILRRGAIASWIASHSAGYDISSDMCREFARFDPPTAWFFRLASMPGIRLACARVACQYLTRKASREAI